MSYMDKFYFPKGFFWGSSTSAHQVEGNNKNDWTEWELQNAELQMLNAKKQKWPNFILERYPSPLEEANYISGKACDHHNRFSEDFDIAKSLGHNAHRFSIEWSRIEPEEGKFDEGAIEHYRDVVEALRERGLEPFVTLWHWTIPLWLRDKGGVECKEFPMYFSRLTEFVIKNLSNEIKFWITLNEPDIYAMNAYLRGIWPPQKKSLFKFLKILKNLAEAHKIAYSNVLKNLRIDTNIGIAKNNVYFTGWPSTVLNYFWNEWFLNNIKNHQDFIGLNYYFYNNTKGFKLNQNENKKLNDMGWGVYPEGIYHILKNIQKKYDKPIYITENGLADSRDINRGEFIKDTLNWVAKAITEGVDARGYFHWSLLDNFEWDKGFWPRFGLVEVDYKTMERKIRPSALEFKKIIENGLDA